MNAEQSEKRVGYTYKALAAATGLSERFWRLQVAQGLPHVKFGKAVLILPADLERFLASRRTQKEARNQESLQATA